MTTLTDKELIKEIKERIGSLDVRDNIERRAYEIALASLEAEPVGEFYEYKPGDWYQRSVGDKAPKWVPLYAVPPVLEIQADVAQAIENLKQKLVECNRYNYCSDAVKGVEDACLVVALQNQYMSAPIAPIAPEAIEYAIEYIRSIAFHIDEDDYHGKHIAHFMRQALTWLEGDSYRDGNCPVTLDAWISCSERMPKETGDIIVVSDGIVMSGISYSRRDGFYIAALEYDDDEPIGGVTHWMPLPEPPQEVK